MGNLNSKSIGEFVSENYRTAVVFQKYAIDFCCKGGRTINEVCENKKIAPGVLLADLEEASKQDDNQGTDFQSLPLDLLADYIETNHHKYIKEKTPALKQYLDKICKVHGNQHPELLEINEQFNASAYELAIHMKKEEFILFPFIREMAKAENKHEKTRQANFGTIQNPIQMMMADHATEGKRFERISLLSNSYSPPADACTTYRVAYSMLKEFEEDLHLHIHLENNILFPKAIAMESRVNALKTGYLYPYL